MKKHCFKAWLVLVVTIGMAFSFSGIQAHALQIGTPSIQSKRISTEAKDSGNKAIQPDITPSSRNGIYVSSIVVYPAVTASDNKIYYYEDIDDYDYYNVKSSTTAYTFSQNMKDSLIEKFKQSANINPTGWVVKITFDVQTIGNYPASLYLKLNGEKLSTYPIYVGNGYSETITYYTPTDSSSLSGYIQYENGRTELVSSGTIAPSTN